MVRSRQKVQTATIWGVNPASLGTEAFPRSRVIFAKSSQGIDRQGIKGLLKHVFFVKIFGHIDYCRVREMKIL